MTGRDRGVGFGRRHGPESTPRLRLKRKAPTTGYVDGAWWPHSDDLTAELPDLLAVLSVRLGDISRLVYHRAEWKSPPRKVHVGNQLIRLDGYDRQPDNTVGVVDLRGGSIVLLVVPPNTSEQDAHAIMMAASTPDDASRIESLLASGHTH
ncbi:DUF5994 family protein [Mycolicibacterium sp.]|uniref:DUF5994 family protein n=1 Tax=Mycolicibacterium sp. TaxID=2320850 RepID=UPI003D0B69A5